MKNNILYFAFMLILDLTNIAYSQNIVINEVLASNTNSIQDEDGTHQDWIELYNDGAITVNLLGFGLTDDPSLLYKWIFPNISIAS